MVYTRSTKKFPRNLIVWAETRFGAISFFFGFPEVPNWPYGSSVITSLREVLRRRGAKAYAMPMGSRQLTVRVMATSHLLCEAWPGSPITSLLMSIHNGWP